MMIETRYDLTGRCTSSTNGVELSHPRKFHITVYIPMPKAVKLRLPTAIDVPDNENENPFAAETRKSIPKGTKTPAPSKTELLPTDRIPSKFNAAEIQTMPDRAGFCIAQPEDRRSPGTAQREWDRSQDR